MYNIYLWGEKMKKFINGEYIEMTETEIAEIQTTDKDLRLYDLKQKLAETDYVACKIAEGAATKEEYAQILADRQRYRDEINELENKDGKG